MDAQRRARAQRQERVAKVVWGTFFVTMGVLFTLHDMGRIDLGEPRSKFSAAYAVDGDATTRWSSAFGQPQWLTVDLGSELPLGKVRLSWESAFAKSYELQTSTNGLEWTTARRVDEGHGGIEDQALDTSARFVRLLGLSRATPYGFSVWEMEVYDSSGVLVSHGKTATSSSVEDSGPFVLWIQFWPLLLVASGLPLVLAPRDDASQVFGLALTAIGGVVQLQHLRLVPWTAREAASVLLIAIGVLILLQSLRRRESTRDGGADPTQGTR
jgi:hypothetical protein